MPNHENYKPAKYIDPLRDFAFKKIFGSAPNKDLLIAFLNGVFSGRKLIIDLTFDKNEHHGDIKEESLAIFDLICTGDNGERFLIEVQRSSQKYFKERVLFYTSRLICEQVTQVDYYKKYNLSEVYAVALLDNFTLKGSAADKYIHDIGLCDKETGELFYDKLGYIFIELIKFDKTETELVTDQDKWFYVLKNMAKMNKLPVFLKKTIFEKLFNIAEYTNLTPEEKMLYDSDLKRKWDNESVLETAKEEGMEIGEERGIVIGEERGIVIGREEGIVMGEERGIVIGKNEEAISIALELKKEGMPTSFITRVTKLSAEEIEKL